MEIGQTYQVSIEEEFHNQWTGPQGIARIEGIEVRIPSAKVGEQYRVTVTSIGTNQWTQRAEATVSDVQRVEPEPVSAEPDAQTRGDNWYAVARRDEVGPGSVKAVKPRGKLLALVNLDGELYALEGNCPHRGGPLAGGKLLGQELACPWHGFRFDPRSGQVAMPRTGFPPLPTYPVRVVGDEVQVQLLGDTRTPDPRGMVGVAV